MEVIILNNEFSKIIEEMIYKELEYSKKLKNLGEKIKHPLLRALFIGISLDSEKHSKFYRAILSLLKETLPLISEDDLNQIKEEIKQHIETEARMLEITKNLLNKAEDPRLKLILAALYQDENNHHKLLIDIERNIAKKETFTEADYWEAVWKDSPWHGAPGG